MNNTKENILQTSLRLFAQNGYSSVSTGDIAGELGLSKGALYKHYKNKRDILDNLVKRMIQIDEERSKQFFVPEKTFRDCPESYSKISWENFQNFAISQFDFWTKDPFASLFRKMLVLEQFKDAKMGNFLQACLTAGPVNYVKDIFKKMISNGILKKSDPELLAIEFYAPLYLLIHFPENEHAQQKRRRQLKKWIQQFHSFHSTAPQQF